MALFSRLCTSKNSLNGLFNRLCKVSKYNNVQVANISGRLNRIGVERPPPFNYREKSYNMFYWYYDYNVERLDENSRIVVVDGPIAAGKDKFARELAKELDMAYMPAPTFDRLCVDAYGFDIRTVDHDFPQHIQQCDVERFLTNPRHANVPAFEVQYYVIKFEAYIESLCHLLSTGEGVVVNRPLFSNFVFMKAMHKAGYINKRCYRYYNKILEQTYEYIMRPHLVIYLDIPVDVVQDRIKERCIPYEVNSEVLTTKFLTDIDTIYKQEYLPQIEKHAYVLMYDWVCGGDISDIVEDIERINFEYDKQQPQKLEDWIFGTLNELVSRRKLYTREGRFHIMKDTYVPDFEATEMFLFGEDMIKEAELKKKYEPKYAIGYNRDKGDKIWWKLRVEDDIVFPRVITNKELLAES